jgi:hypothetical protein
MKTRALLLALPLLALGCTDNRASIQIQGMCAPTATCAFTSKCDAFALGPAIIDPTFFTTVSQEPYLTLILQLENTLPNNANADIKKLNTNNAHIDEAHMEYSGILTGNVTIGASGQVPANGNELIYLDVIPGAKGLELPASPPQWPLYLEATAQLRLRGYFDDGSRFETGEFPVTVQVSNTSRPQDASSGVKYCVDACPHGGQWPATCPTP